MFLHLLDKDEHKAAFLELAHQVTEADGYVNRKEKQYLTVFRAEMNEPAAAARTRPERTVAEIVGGIEDERVRRIFFAELLVMTYSDGDYNDKEKQMLTEVRRLFGISRKEYDAFLSWVKRLDELSLEGMKLIMGIA